MISTESIFQCGVCLRQHDGQGGVLAFQPPSVVGIPGPLACGLGDCLEVQGRRERAEAVKREWRRTNRSAKCEVRSAKCRSGQRATVRGDARPTGESARLPHPQDSNDVRRPVVVDEGLEGSAREDALPTGEVVTAKDFSQSDFVASNAAASQNARLLEFFLKPHNFGKWFKSTFLEELSGATRMNNRAVDLRPGFIRSGWYLDNCMIRDGHSDKVASHYRLCAIEEALSLSEGEKFRLIHGYEMPPAGQQEIPVGD